MRGDMKVRVSVRMGVRVNVMVGLGQGKVKDGSK